MGCFTDCCTSRASEGRGSSLTLGKTSAVPHAVKHLATKQARLDLIRHESGKRRRLSFVVRPVRETRTLLPRKRKGLLLLRVIVRFVSARVGGSLARVSSVVVKSSKSPNKAPEPTSFAVTSRAIARLTEVQPPKRKPIEARAAPAKAVAHL
jgi:hypothetical protein